MLKKEKKQLESKNEFDKFAGNRINNFTSTYTIMIQRSTEKLSLYGIKSVYSNIN